MEKSEAVVRDLESELQREGVVYPTLNEPTATARAILWSAWVSWLWTSKSERDLKGEPPDYNAKKVRPLVEALLERAIKTGRAIGKGGGIPDDFFLESSENPSPEDKR